MYTLELSKSAIKSLQDIPTSDIKKITKKIDSLEKNPRPAQVEKLSGYENLYRVRSGDYRIIYQIFDKKLLVLVIKIGHRREIYKNLPPNF